ncbi:MAG: hypothetical protein HC842_03140 [Cytophagales bacterium]|nr:hypothetical protein [Cytophagales bacterium]
MAILMNDNKLQYSMVEIYFRFNRPAVPTRVFISLKKATYWLKSLLRTEKDTAELAPASNQNQV